MRSAAEPSPESSERTSADSSPWRARRARNSCSVRALRGEEEVNLWKHLCKQRDGRMAGRTHKASLHQARVEQAGEHKTRFDGLSQAAFVRQHEARLRRREHLVRHADLVGFT